jgi:DNA primase
VAELTEFQKIKQRIFQEEKIEDVLEKLECWSIDTEQSGKLYVAGLPDGDTKRSVQIKNTEYLSAAIRTKGINGDIFDVVSYIIYNSESEESRKATLNKSKFWVCQQLGYVEFIDDFYKETADPTTKIHTYNKWLQDIRRKRKQSYTIENEVLPDSVLNQFGNIPYKGWLDEGLTIRTQKKFQIGIDVKSDRVTFPIHNSKNQLVGIKGRYCGKDKRIEESYKYLYIYPCNKSIEFYNFNRALSYIEKNKEVYIVEGAKTTWYLDQWGYQNVISIEGDSLSDQQISLLKRLPLNTVFTFVWDKDKTAEFVVNEAKRLTGRLKYGIFDKDNLLEGKDSPSDKGKEVWEKLCTDYKYRIKG